MTGHERHGTDLILPRVELPARQFEEGGAELQQQDVRQAVLVHQQHAVHGPPHAVLIVLVAHALEPRRHARVLLEQRVLGAEGVVGERVEVDGSAERQGRVLGEAGLSGEVGGGGGGGGPRPAGSRHRL